MTLLPHTGSWGMVGRCTKQHMKAGTAEPLWMTPVETMVLPLTWHECVSFHWRERPGPGNWNEQQGLSEPGGRLPGSGGDSPAAFLAQQSILCAIPTSTTLQTVPLPPQTKSGPPSALVPCLSRGPCAGS